jgi:hypothetical protein
MIEGLPDRRLTEKEVDQLRESDQFKDIFIRGRFIGPTVGVAEELVITLTDGTEKEIGYFLDTGWRELEEIDPE